MVGDGTSLTFVVVDDRAQYLARVPAAGGAVEKLIDGRQVVTNPSAGSDGAFAVLASTATTLPEVHALEGGKLRRLSTQNEWLKDVLLGTTEEFTSTSKDGTEVHGLIVKPPTYPAGTRYPALLRIHGGPNGQDEHSFSFERELFAANGYVVVAVNYRGSNGRGSAFQKAIFADWGDKEVVDLLGAMDHIVKIGLADPNRLGLGGWSYGGILTDYTIATDTRFKAGISGAGSANQLSMYGTDQYITQYEQEIGPPWKNPGSLDQDLVSVLPGRPHQDADAVPVRGEGLQRAAARQRADVSGAAEPRRRHPARDLSEPVPRHHDAELQERPAPALPRLVRQVPEAADDDHGGLGAVGNQPSVPSTLAPMTSSQILIGSFGCPFSFSAGAFRLPWLGWSVGRSPSTAPR